MNGAFRTSHIFRAKKKDTALANSAIQSEPLLLSRLLHIMTAQRRSLRPVDVLFVAIATLCLASSSSAVTTAVAMDATQVSALLEVAAACPYLTASGNTWTQANLQNACSSPTAASGIRACNATGFPTKIDIPTFIADPCPLSASFSKLPALTSLIISAPINGTLPEAWSALTQLTTIELDETNIVGSIPSSWSSMTSLTSLSIEFDTSNTATNTVAPDWMGKLTELELENIGWSSFPSSLVDSSSSLTSITLTNAKIQGAFPASLESNTKLQNLEISNSSNFVSSFGLGLALPSFSGMTALQHLTLSGLAFGGTMPAGFPSSLLSLSFASLPNLGGSIPTSLLDLPNLFGFSFQYMPSLIGGIPAPTNVAASKLGTVTIADSGLDGTIASAFASLPRVTVLTLKNLKGLSGTLSGPVGTTELPCNYIIVTITGTSISGPIPATFFSRCPFIATAALDNNRYTGSLPDTLAASVNNSKLTSLTISNNPMMSGTIPNIHFASQTTQLTLKLNSAGLYGSIPLSLLNTSGVGYSTFELSANQLDLCANANSSVQTAFASSGLAQIKPTCNLFAQLPTECGCPSAWPAVCFLARPMAPTCAAIPPSEATPSAPGTSTPSAPSNTPSAQPNTGAPSVGSVPTSDDGPAPSSASFLAASFILAAALCAFAIAM